MHIMLLCRYPSEGVGVGQRPWVVVVWCVGLVAGTVLFHGFGGGALSTPPWAPGGWHGWLQERGPVIATVAVLRLLVLGLCWYLVGVTVIGVVARLLRAARLLRVADALTVPWLRRLLQQGLGVTLAAAMIAGAAGSAAGAASRPAAAAVPEHAGSAQPTEAPARAGSLEQPDDALVSGPPGPALVSGPPGPAGAALVRLDDLPLPVPFGRAPGEVGAELPPPVTDRADVALAPRAGDGSTGPVQPDRGAHSYIVRSGDSFWRIAEQRLSATLERAPTDHELIAYWHAVIEENRGNLPDPDDPDLILPGQRLTLPIVPGT